MAPPPLLPVEAFALEREDGDYAPVEQAIRNALRQATLIRGQPQTPASALARPGVLGYTVVIRPAPPGGGTAGVIACYGRSRA
jgi:hypothetical protein